MPPPTIIVKILHLFSGKANKVGGLAYKVATRSQELRSQGVEVVVEEVDLLVNPNSCDLLKDGVYNRLRLAAKKGEFFAVVAGIPCNSYCVGRFPNETDNGEESHDGGARPLRDRWRPTGLPMHELRPSDRRALVEGNTLTIRSLDICACVYMAGGEVVIENPVDYGGKHGWLKQHRKHAPLWLMPWTKTFIEATGSETEDFAQCTHGSDFKKMTTLCYTPALRKLMLEHFAGPRRRCCKEHCPHGGRHPKAAIGTNGHGKYNSAEAAAYPPQMNFGIADAIITIVEERQPKRGFEAMLGQTRGVKPPDTAARHAALERSGLWKVLQGEEAKQAMRVPSPTVISAAKSASPTTLALQPLAAQPQLQPQPQPQPQPQQASPAASATSSPRDAAWGAAWAAADPLADGRAGAPRQRPLQQLRARWRNSHSPAPRPLTPPSTARPAADGSSSVAALARRGRRLRFAKRHASPSPVLPAVELCVSDDDSACTSLLARPESMPLETRPVSADGSPRAPAPAALASHASHASHADATPPSSAAVASQHARAARWRSVRATRPRSASPNCQRRHGARQTRETRDAWMVYQTPRLGLRRPWHKHTKIHTWPLAEPSPSPTKSKNSKTRISLSQTR